MRLAIEQLQQFWASRIYYSFCTRCVRALRPFAFSVQDSLDMFLSQERKTAGVPMT